MPGNASTASRTFQSTHSLRSATTGWEIETIQEGVSIHALLAECDAQAWRALAHAIVSIHALLAECDDMSRAILGRLDVSIHALLAECDSSQS